MARKKFRPQAPGAGQEEMPEEEGAEVAPTELPPGENPYAKPIKCRRCGCAHMPIIFRSSGLLLKNHQIGDRRRRIKLYHQCRNCGAEKKRTIVVDIDKHKVPGPEMGL